MAEWTAAQYDAVWKRIGGVKRYHRKLHACVAKYVPRDGSVVDIGCGTGEMLALLESQGRTGLTGVDFSQVALDIAATRTRATLTCADIHTYDFRSFDFAVLTEVLEHIEDDALALPERWVASVPNGPGLATNHVRVYTPSTVAERYGATVYEADERFIIFGR